MSNKSKLTDEVIEKTLKVYDEYSKKCESQKARGLNDFNIFNILLKISDEVRLHTRFIHSMLDPNGTHGQGTLFLDIFLDECDLVGHVNLSSCKVFKEYQFIDLYITDGNKHIIIENKIYADDQDKQIERYIDVILNENEEVQDIMDNIIIVYLSLDRKLPSKCSLGGFSHNDNYLVKGDIKYKYLSIHYRNTILNWIKSSKNQVANITNLFVGLTQYEEVILMLYRQYKGKVMSLKDFICRRDDGFNILKSIRDINDEYPKVKHKFMLDYFSVVEDKLRKVVPHENWQIVIDKDKLSAKSYIPLRIQQSDNSKVYFGYDFEDKDYCKGFYAVRFKNKGADLNACKNNEVIKSLLNNIEKPFSNTKSWFGWDWYKNGDDLFDCIIDEGNINKSAQDFVDEFYDAFNSYRKVIVKCNELLG